MPTFTSWGALKKYAQQKHKEAMSETMDKSFQAAHRNVDNFYASPSSPNYKRTGQLAESPESELSGGGDNMHGEIRLDTSYKYNPSDRDTQTIYGYAEDGGLWGNGGFWEETKQDVQHNIDICFGKRFSR